MDWRIWGTSEGLEVPIDRLAVLGMAIDAMERGELLTGLHRSSARHDLFAFSF